MGLSEKQLLVVIEFIAPFSVHAMWGYRKFENISSSDEKSFLLLIYVYVIDFKSAQSLFISDVGVQEMFFTRRLSRLSKAILILTQLKMGIFVEKADVRRKLSF